MLVFLVLTHDSQVLHRRGIVIIYRVRIFLYNLINSGILLSGGGEGSEFCQVTNDLGSQETQYNSQIVGPYLRKSI